MKLHDLVEAFTSVVPYTWTIREIDYTRGAFKVGDVEYNVHITGGHPIQSDHELKSYDGDETPVIAPGYPRYWEVVFSAKVGGKSTHSNTGTGGAWEVFSTVIDMVRDHMEKFGVGPIYVGAFDVGRQRLYPKMLRKFLVGWTVEVGEDGNEFIAYPPNAKTK